MRLRWIGLVLICFVFIVLCSCTFGARASHDIQRGKMLYQATMANPESIKGWVMEGPGEVAFKDGWMEMYSPNEKMGHVYWCPQDLPNRFIAEWQSQNLHTEAGLCIIFFSAKGMKGEDIFSKNLPKRDGTFKQYTRGKIGSYHISYYANTPSKPNRPHSHLRKNNMFALVCKGPPGIPAKSEKVYHMRLVKNGAHIKFFVGDKLIIDWTDDGKKYGPVYTSGKIGFRQMKWTRFRYRNFRVWELNFKEYEE